MPDGRKSSTIRHFIITYGKGYQQFSISMALAPPPPLQIPAAPILPLFCFNTLIRVTMILAPLQPNGCPI